MPANLSCVSCARSFGSKTALGQHERDSPDHKHNCKICNRSFANGIALAQHLQQSSVHAVPSASRKAQHKNVRSLVKSIPYDGIPASEIRPVYQLALRLRHSNPEPRRIIELSRTTLETRVVSAIIDGALRLLPPSQDPAREAARIQKIRDRTERALHAERSFVKRVRAYQRNLMDETQQKQQMRHPTGSRAVPKTRITPDILFKSPTIIHGLLCHWIEYKDTFGFKQNPFIHKQHLKQFRKYATALGSGMVVYSVGFECELFCIEGVACFREAEVVSWLDNQMAHQKVPARAG